VRRIIAVALFAVACGSITVQAHTISLAYKSGDVYKYALHAALDYTIGAQGISMPVTVDLTGKETVSVKSVDADGSANLSIALTDTTLKTINQGTTTTTTGTAVPAIEMKVGPDGRVISVNNSQLGGLSALGGTQAGFITAVLPDATVKPGDTWTKNYDQAGPSGSGSVHVTTTSKYQRDEQLSGVNAAVIATNIADAVDVTLDFSALLGGLRSSVPPTGGDSVTGTSLIIKGTATSAVTSWIDPGAHRVMKTHATGKSEGTMTISSAPGSTGLLGPLTFKGTQTLDMNPA
jgi:hypothetical protein